jgi:hypothetical protein
LSCAQALRPSAQERGLVPCTYPLEYRGGWRVQPLRAHCCEHGAPQSDGGRRASGCLHMMKDIRKSIETMDQHNAKISRLCLATKEAHQANTVSKET